MTKPSLILALTLSLALGVACSREDVSGPQSNSTAQLGAPVFTRLEVTPGSIQLVAEGTSQLVVKAWDQFGTPMLAPADGNADGELANRTLFQSTDMRVVDVSSRGLVRGIASGIADIRATLTLGGITRTTSMHVSVDGPSGFPAGDYDLTAKITLFDPAWGDLTGYSYTGVLRFPSSGIGATWESFRLIDAAGVPSEWVSGGVITSYKDYAGRIVSELASSNFHIALIAPVTNAQDSRLVTGTWGCCGHIAGTFIARRR
jgi:hypothetical protein